jgi:hypothetical protein
VGWGLILGGEWYWVNSGGDVSQKIGELEVAMNAYSGLEEKIIIFEQRLKLIGGVEIEGEDEVGEVFSKVIKVVDSVGGEITDLSYKGKEWDVGVEVRSAGELEKLNELLDSELSSIECEVSIWGPISRKKAGEYVEDFLVVCGLNRKGIKGG